jgi:hypothetical protein
LTNNRDIFENPNAWAVSAVASYFITGWLS